ncbi:MAG: diguanylate cyclase [Thermoanaerobaculia bacterium]|nr:diguanylate cyclase [Thermoanaerobaculia bacterium]
MDLDRRRTDHGATPQLRILAVDDQPSYLTWLQLVLGRAGFDVEVALDGMTAIERIRNGAPIDLLLVDLTMPGMDGIETVRQIQQEARLPGLYTILLTASDKTDTKLRALDSGFDAFIAKTSPESEIVAKIRSAARRLQLERRLHSANAELEALALTDELTGIANRRSLFRAAEAVFRGGRKLAVILIDLDRFKSINDTYGHPAGDVILADVGATLKSHTRINDIAGRYGGDEFVILVPDGTPCDAQQLAGRVLDKIRQLRWMFDGKAVSIGAQHGIAVSNGAITNLTELIASSDQALYLQKRLGSSRAPLERVAI